MMYTDYRFSRTIVDDHATRLHKQAEHRRTVRIAKSRTADRAPRG